MHDQLVTLPPLGKGSVSVKHQMPLDAIRAADVQVRETYRIKLTNTCLGTQWYTFGTAGTLEGMRVCAWRSARENTAAIEEEVALDDDLRIGIRVERQDMYRTRPVVDGEDPATPAMVSQMGEIEFEVV